jgi:DnaJ-class molecular chaperone
MRFSIEMYRIRMEKIKIKVPCERCSEKGIVDKNCHKCGGNGVHNKTIKVWKVSPRTETIYKIDRNDKDSYYHGIQTAYEGGLRYWISASEYFNEENRCLHFNKSDAQKECDRRNANIIDILKNKQKLPEESSENLGDWLSAL